MFQFSSTKWVQVQVFDAFHHLKKQNDYEINQNEPMSNTSSILL